MSALISWSDKCWHSFNDQSPRQPPWNFRNHILWVKTAFLQHVLGLRLLCWEVNSWNDTPWRWRQTLKRVGILVKQHDLVYKRQCMKFWFNEDKIKLSLCTVCTKLSYCEDISMYLKQPRYKYLMRAFIS